MKSETVGVASRIDLKNVKEYLCNKGFLGPSEAASFTEIHKGVSSVIIQITKEGGERFILKQPLSRIINLEQREVSGSWPLERSLWEQDCIDLMNEFLPPGVVPKVCLHDKSNFLFVMTAAPEGARTWQELLLAGRSVEPAIARKIGHILAIIHNNTAENARVQELFRNKVAYIMGRIDPCYREIPKAVPDLADPVQKLIDKSVKIEECLCTADFNPKNTLVSGLEFMLVDHEGAHYGDPAFDVGLFLAHLLLKSIHKREMKDAYFALVESLWTGYYNTVSVWSIGPFERRVVQHAALMMLGRVVGKLPVNYLTDTDKTAAIEVSKQAVLQGVTTVSRLLDIVTHVLTTQKRGETQDESIDQRC